MSRGTGPGFVVAAAFIGPGTVTACTLAGAAHGLTLLWILVLAVLATLALQEMSARLALTTGTGLAESLSRLAPPWGRAVAWLTGLAAVLGVIAFEAGNLSGAGLGLAAVTGTEPALWTGLTAAGAAALLLTGRYRLLERVLMVAVGLMGFAFLATAIAVAPAWDALLTGLLVPGLPAGAPLTGLALVGTTIVPYNLYLHAAAVRERWTSPEDLGAARRDLVLAVVVGGIISMAIVITASATLGGTDVHSAVDMAAQLEPLLGAWARGLFGLGLATAGLTSAITAPLAAAYVLCGLTGAQARLASPQLRTVLLGCIGIGTVIALTDVHPVRLIVSAQAANGLILPVIAIALVAALNDRRLGPAANRWGANLIGGVIVVLCTALAAKTLLG